MDWLMQQSQSVPDFVGRFLCGRAKPGGKGTDIITSPVGGGQLQPQQRQGRMPSQYAILMFYKTPRCIYQDAASGCRRSQILPCPA